MKDTGRVVTANIARSSRRSATSAWASAFARRELAHLSTVEEEHIIHLGQHSAVDELLAQLPSSVATRVDANDIAGPAQLDVAKQRARPGDHPPGDTTLDTADRSQISSAAAACIACSVGSPCGRPTSSRRV